MTTILLERFSGREENDRRNYFIIIQTRICCQTRYRLRYAARYTSYSAYIGLMHEKYSQSRNIAEYEKIEFPYLKGLLLKADITPLSLMSRGMLLIRIIDMRVYLFNLSTPLISELWKYVLSNYRRNIRAVSPD